MGRQSWFAELAGDRDIPVRTLDIHRVQCYFAQGPCLLLQALPERETRVNELLTSEHAKAAVVAMAQLHAMYWNFSPTHNKDFLYDEPCKSVPFFRLIVAPGSGMQARFFQITRQSWNHWRGFTSRRCTTSHPSFL